MASLKSFFIIEGGGLRTMFVLVGAGGGKAYREIIDELRDWMGDGDLERELKPTWLMLVEDVFIDR